LIAVPQALTCIASIVEPESNSRGELSLYKLACKEKYKEIAISRVHTVNPLTGQSNVYLFIFFHNFTVNGQSSCY
jgi:hypothetical protein